MENRKHMGKNKDDAIFPVAPALSEMSGSYTQFIEDIKSQIQGRKDLKDAFPEMSGFSPRNIKYKWKFAQCWPDYEFVQQVAAQIPWRTNLTLLDKVDTRLVCPKGH